MIRMTPNQTLGLSITFMCFGLCLSTAFEDEFTVVWSQENIVASDSTNDVRLSLYESGGASFASKQKYLFGAFSVKLKLIPGESAGTVSAFYLTSYNTDHDEVDFEFLGNVSGQPYVVHTNIYSNGVGSREQRFFLWFDPGADFHTYSIIWNHEQITWLVDDTPIRVYKNILEVYPDSFPYSNPMVVAGSIYDASTWATRGGAVPANWNYSPFVVTYKDFKPDACKVDDENSSTCTASYEENWWEGTSYQSLSATQTTKLKQIQQDYMIYDYCTDLYRYSTPPVECAYNSV